MDKISRRDMKTLTSPPQINIWISCSNLRISTVDINRPTLASSFSLRAQTTMIKKRKKMRTKMRTNCRALLRDHLIQRT